MTSDWQKVPQELLKRIATVTNKRARFLLDGIAKNGSITTEDLKRAGYNHPPRAARDARELGFLLTTTRKRDSDGRTIAAYCFAEGGIGTNKTGRGGLPKKEREALLSLAENKCQLCGDHTNLQVDHRIPYQVAGESQRKN